MTKPGFKAFLLLLISFLAFSAQSIWTLANTATQFRLSPQGAALVQTDGTSVATGTGFARIRMEQGSNFPAGVAIFGLRQNGTLISEAAVSAATPSTSGRLYAEIGDGVDTGLAIANPNDTIAQVSFYFTDGGGSAIRSGVSTFLRMDSSRVFSVRILSMVSLHCVEHSRLLRPFP